MTTHPARDLDVLVESHKIARSRVLAGKPSWDKKINIKRILDANRDDETEATAAKVANEIAALLRKRLPETMLQDDYTIIEIVEGMEGLEADSYADCDDYSALEDLNNMLAQLYDWADIERVWLGG